MYTLVLVAFLINGEVKSPNDVEGYQTQEACQIVLADRLQSFQSQFPKGTAITAAACLEVKNAGNPA